MPETNTIPRSSPSAIRYDRQQEHKSVSAKLLDYFMRLPQDMQDEHWPSTSELQEMKIFGLRPINRLTGNLVRGRHNGHRYDFERLSFGNGVYRWRLYWPNRPGYPKSKNQIVLPLESEHVGSPQIHKARKSPGAWKAQSIVSAKSWQQVCAERDAKLNQPEPEFSLQP